MRASLLIGIKQLETREVATPKIVDDSDVLVRIKTVGVCGSDIHYYTTGRIGSQVVRFPFIIGHETSGIVEETGKKVTRVIPGQRVAIDPAVSCGHCDQCKCGRENTCRALRFMGAPGQLDGCLCEYIVITEKSCYPLVQSMAFEQATIAEPLAIGVYSVERSPLMASSNVAVLGVGPIGMCVFSALRTKSIGKVYVTDKIEERLAFSKQLNPAWSGNPDRSNIAVEISKREPLLLDIVYECSGDPAAISQAVELLKPGGTLVIVGITETDEISFPIHELRRKELTILNIRRQSHCTQKAIDMIAQHPIIADSMITHRFRLEETALAFDLVANRSDGVMKAMIFIE
jgi:L-iditol 2-dehydrogenase